MMTLKENTLFDDRYKLLRKLGEGGYSEVWYVEDTFAKIKLALKIFLPSAQLDERGIELFRNEFTVIYNLNHSNLLKCTYLGVANGCPYLVMPYYEGGSAENLIGKCDESTCWAFLHDVSAGLAHLHDQHPPIIHQDIKPDNILVDKGKYVITDFGISFNMRNALAGDVEEAVVKGTKPYMPPEKFQQDSTPLMAGDIWALGASAYELVTGHLPFKNGGLDQQEETPIPSLPDHCSEELRALVSQCLNFHPWERPFAKDVEQLTALKIPRKVSKTGEIVLPEQSEVKKRKNGLLLVIVAAVVVGMVALVAVHLLRGNGQTPEEQPPTALSVTNAEDVDTTLKADQLTSSKTEAHVVSRPAEPAELPAVKENTLAGNPASKNISSANGTLQSKAEPRGESRNNMVEEAKKKAKQPTEIEFDGDDRLN